ncbi:MAG: hypothetical protein L0227_12100 [Chloroflexi bacterium]|nr:hypothetical protein [Chloroflexota bacterium]
MDRRPDPDELTDIEASRPTIRPDHGYRVGARISVGDRGRTRLAAGIAVVVVLAGMAMSRIWPAQPELPVAPLDSRSFATPLPALAILRPPATTRLLPVAAGGLRWLDPADGTMAGDPYTAPRDGLFVDSEGRAVCVCLEIPWSDDAQITRVTMIRYSATGGELARATPFELQAADRRVAGPTIQVDAAIAPDGSKAWIVHTVLGETGWEIGIHRIDLATLTVDASRAVEVVPTPPDGGEIGRAGAWVVRSNSAMRATLRVSPDGSQLAILEAMFTNAALDLRIPIYQQQRLVVSSDLDPAVAIEVATPAHDAVDDPCNSEHSAWATASRFVTVCSRLDGDGTQPFVRIDDRDGSSREVTVGPAVATNDTEWLLDGRHGVLYRWSTTAHILARLDVTSGGVASVVIDPSREGRGDLGPWPSQVTGPTPWAPLTGPDVFVEPPRMVGSQDGTLIYALGDRSIRGPVGDDGLASTGIWVFDATRTELVARWAPAALYGQIGYAPGWERLVTLGLPGSDGNGSPADWRTSIRFHDARTGEVSELLGDVQEESGFVPALLAPNAPGGIAGY